MTSNKLQNTSIIFSHGFGIKKDNLGLFTFLSEKFNDLGYKSYLFDYYGYDDKAKEVHTISFSKQATILQSKIKEVKELSPSTRIVIIGHSQGSIIPALCNVTGVSKVICISPFFITDKEAVLARYSARKGSITDFSKISRRLHSNGETTIIYPEYWKERFNTNQYDLYNKLGSLVPLTMVYGLNDELVKTAQLEKITKGKLVSIEADHDITGESKNQLFQILGQELN